MSDPEWNAVLLLSKRLSEIVNRRVSASDVIRVSLRFYDITDLKEVKNGKNKDH